MNDQNPKKIDVVIDLPIYLLQTLRLAQAIGEASFRVCIDREDTKAVVRLKEVFGFDYRVGKAGAKYVTGLYIDHLGPVTRIGSIERPLIVPRAILEHCRDRWRAVRQYDASFAGLLTTTRRLAINQWLSLSKLEEMSLAEPTLIEKQLTKWAHRLRLPVEERRGNKNVIIRTSDMGRHFPVKSWNTTYYDLMLNSKFVLCPSGDFKANGVAWTYRFFEGAMCGTIPIVEETCPAYEGYRFRLMSEPVSALKWLQEDAEHNFALAWERMTIETERLRAEVLRLLVEPDDVRNQGRHNSASEIHST